jgi:hypothetical protein
LIGGKIPLFRQVTNSSRNLLKTITAVCCHRGDSSAKSVIFVVFAAVAARPVWSPRRNQLIAQRIIGTLGAAAVNAK